MPRLKKYKPIEKEFTQSIFTLREVDRVDGNGVAAAVYEKRITETGKVVGFEAIRIRFSDGGLVKFGNGVETVLEPKEVYPSDSKWGIDGYTLAPTRKGYKKAVTRMNQFLGDV